jgi:hypothetical protein
MRKKQFPLARDLNGRPVWLAHEVEAFLSTLPQKKYLAAQSNDTASTVRVKQKGRRND